METGKSKSLDPLWAEVSGYWVSACFQPWSVAVNWNTFLSERWKQWLSAVASAPNPWLPALADERSGQSPSIDFFLPWLPHLDAVSGEVRPVGIDEAVSVMRKAAALHRGGTSSSSGAGFPKGLAEDGARLASDTPAAAEAVAVKPARRAASSGKRVSAADAEVSSDVKKAAAKGRRPAAQAAPRNADGAAKDVPKGTRSSAPTKLK